MAYGNSVYDKMSRAEELVSSFLKEIGIYWIFESPVFVKDDQGRPRVWSPDFYLPELGMYIEVACDTANRNYEYRWHVYTANHIPVILVRPYEDKSWKKNLVQEINNIHQQRWEILKGLQ